MAARGAAVGVGRGWVAEEVVGWATEVTGGGEGKARLQWSVVFVPWSVPGKYCQQWQSARSLGFMTCSH